MNGIQSVRVPLQDAKMQSDCVSGVTVRIGEEYELDKRRLVKSAHVSARIVVVRLR